MGEGGTREKGIGREVLDSMAPACLALFQVTGNVYSREIYIL